MSKDKVLRKIAPAKYVRQGFVWVYLGELASIVGLTSKGVWDGFLPLNKEAPLSVLVAPPQGTNGSVLSRDSSTADEFDPYIIRGDLCVPWRWAEEVLRLSSLGVCLVRWRHHPHLDNGMCLESDAWGCEEAGGDHFAGFVAFDRMGRRMALRP